jgi:hypothetical protein
LKRSRFRIRNVNQSDLLGVAIQQSHDDGLSASRSAGASDLRLLVLVHVARESADDSFVGLDLAFQLVSEGTRLHRQPDALKHEPSGLLGDTQIARDFIARNAVLAIRQQPDDKLLALNRMFYSRDYHCQ